MKVTALKTCTPVVLGHAIYKGGIYDIPDDKANMLIDKGYVAKCNCKEANKAKTEAKGKGCGCTEKKAGIKSYVDGGIVTNKTSKKTIQTKELKTKIETK